MRGKNRNKSLKSSSRFGFLKPWTFPSQVTSLSDSSFKANLGPITVEVAERISGAMYHIEQFIPTLDTRKMYQCIEIDSVHVQACEFLLVEGKDPCTRNLKELRNKKIGTDLYSLGESIKRTLSRFNPLVPPTLNELFLNLSESSDISALIDSSEWEMNSRKLFTAIMVHIAKICFSGGSSEDSNGNLNSLSSTFGSVLILKPSDKEFENGLFSCPIRGKVIARLVEYIRKNLLSAVILDSTADEKPKTLKSQDQPAEKTNPNSCNFDVNCPVAFIKDINCFESNETTSRHEVIQSFDESHQEISERKQEETEITPQAKNSITGSDSDTKSPQSNYNSKSSLFDVKAMTPVTSIKQLACSSPHTPEDYMSLKHGPYPAFGQRSQDLLSQSFFERSGSLCNSYRRIHGERIMSPELRKSWTDLVNSSIESDFVLNSSAHSCRSQSGSKNLKQLPEPYGITSGFTLSSRCSGHDDFPTKRSSPNHKRFESTSPSSLRCKEYNSEDFLLCNCSSPRSGAVKYECGQSEPDGDLWFDFKKTSAGFSPVLKHINWETHLKAHRLILLSENVLTKIRVALEESSKVV